MLMQYHEREDLLVLGLPRGGVPVAFEVASALGAELDILVVRKLGLPGQQELAMGAIASGGICLKNREVFDVAAISDEEFDKVVQREMKELHRREKIYRGDRPPVEIGGSCVILVDDGLATGSTMRAAIAGMRQQGASRVVVAVPVAPPTTILKLEGEADDVICPAKPLGFRAIGQFYDDFSQVDDAEVLAILESAWAQQGGRM